MCECVKKMNEALDKKELNTVIDAPLFISGPDRVTIATAKKDPRKRGKPVSVHSSYCPFCGEKHEKAA